MVEAKGTGSPPTSGGSDQLNLTSIRDYRPLVWCRYRAPRSALQGRAIGPTLLRVMGRPQRRTSHRYRSLESLPTETPRATRGIIGTLAIGGAPGPRHILSVVVILPLRWAMDVVLTDRSHWSNGRRLSLAGLFPSSGPRLPDPMFWGFGTVMTSGVQGRVTFPLAVKIAMKVTSVDEHFPWSKAAIRMSLPVIVVVPVAPW